MRCSLPTCVALFAMLVPTVPSDSGAVAADPAESRGAVASWPPRGASRGRTTPSVTRRYRSYSVAPSGSSPPAAGTTRTYRSYSVTPGDGAGASGAPLDPSGVVGPAGPAEQPVRPAPEIAPKPAGRSKPSYLRGESKALGRFGQ